MGVIYGSSGGEKVMSDKSILVAFFLQHKTLKVIGHNHYLQLGNGSNKFRNH